MTGEGTAGASGADAGTGADAGARVSDGQIAAIVAAANDGVIDLANLAIRQGSAAPVLAFAQALSAARTASQARQNTLLEALNISPEDSPLSVQLTQEATTIATKLLPLTAASFDLAYVESQVALHTELLALFDETLLVNVTQVPLRADLALARQEVSQQLGAASALLALLRAADDAGVDDGGL
jgi:predicted outer membrane protein